MKKKIFCMISLIIIILATCGCVKYNVLMDIKEDKSMDFSIIYAMNKSVLEMSEDKTSILSDEDKNKLVNKGFSVSDYNDENNSGFQITKKITNIDDYSLESDVSYDLSGIFSSDNKDNNEMIFKVTKGVDKNTYTANFKFDSSESNLLEEENEEKVENDENNESEEKIEEESVIETEDSADLNELSESMLANMDLKYVVKLPYGSISDNATSKSDDGKELTWKLNANKIENISFQFELNNSNNKTKFISLFNKGNDLLKNPLIIGGIVGLFGLIIVVILIVFLIGNKKNNKNNLNTTDNSIQTPIPNIENSTNQTVAPVQETVKPVEPVPIEQTVAPVQETVKPVEPVPIEQTVAPVQETVKPVEPVPIEQTVAPVQETVKPVEPVPIEQTVAPVQETVKPVEPAPFEQIIVPVQETTKPVEPTPIPIQQSSSANNSTNTDNTEIL